MTLPATRSLFAFGLIALYAAPQAQAACPPRNTWPTPDFSTRIAETATARAQEIKALEDYAFTLQGTDAERKGPRTDSVLILKGGALVYERYARGYAADKRHIGWSVTKSVTSALAGIAVARGVLLPEESVCKYLPLASANCAITVRQMLQFGSGREWTEVYENRGNQVSSVLAMFYGVGHRDVVEFVSSQPIQDVPGSRYQYSTGEASLALAVVGGALKPSLGETYPWTALFDVLGMTSVVFERDAQGNFHGGSHLYATPRDFARFGYLYLNDGCWAGQRLLPEGWVQESTTPSAPFRSATLDAPDMPQGYMWWRNLAVPEQHLPTLPWPHVPSDAFAARGHWGQSVTVIPSADLVVVRTADDRDSSFNEDVFLSLALAVGR